MRCALCCLTPVLFLFPPARAHAVAGDPPPEAGPFDALISTVYEVEVPAQEMGMLIELLVRQGTYVEEGEMLARVDDSEARIRLERARIDLELAEYHLENDLQVQLARKALGVTEAELQRALDANEQKENTVSETEVERLRFVRDKAALDVEQAARNVREAELTVAQMRNVLELAELAVQRRSIVAPIGGQVVEVRQERGEWVQPGDPVFRIISTQRVLAEALVTVREVPGDVTGQSVRVTLANAGQADEPLEGRIIFVDPRINAVNGQYTVQAEIENPRRTLRPGDRARMTILPADAPPAEGP